MVKDAMGSRVGTINGNNEAGEEVSSASGSGGTRKMARGGETSKRTPLGEEEAYEQDDVVETHEEGDEEESGDCHMTPASGAESENFYTALERDATEALTDVLDAEPSEAPSIKSPHKARRSGASSRQNSIRVGAEQGGKPSRRMGHKTVDFVASESTAGAGAGDGHTSTRGGGSTRKKEKGYMVRVRATVEILIVNLEVLLLA